MRVGFDLVDVRRIDDSIAQFGARFLDRVFTAQEISYSMGRAQPAEHLAARFAAKEATMKALSLSDVGLSWRDIEVVRDAGGECCMRLSGPAAAALRRLEVCGLSVSLSHEGQYAGAVVAAMCRTSCAADQHTDMDDDRAEGPDAK